MSTATKYDNPPKNKSGCCVLCGRKIHTDYAYKKLYCSKECKEMDDMLKEDALFYEEEKKIDKLLMDIEG